jgi:hypothetical protein
MQRGLIGHRAGQKCVAVVFQRDGQTPKPVCPSAIQMALDPDLMLDIGDPNFMADAYDTYADLRAKGPVSRVRFAGGAEEAASSFTPR